MSYRSTPAFAVGGVTPDFRCLVCGAATSTYPKNAVRGICEDHCSDHEFEYSQEHYRFGHFCIHCDAEAPDDWYGEDDIGFGDYQTKPRSGAIGTPASAMNGNAAQRHQDPQAWANWVEFCNANGHPQVDNTILNIRFGTRHLQVVRFRDWIGEIRMGRSPITFRHNPYQAWRRESDPTWCWIEFY